MPGIRVKRSILAASVALTTAIGGCTPATRTPARPPAGLGAASPQCPLAASQLRPLVVEWAGADRGSLELLLRRGLVAVRYAGCELEVLRHCRVPGEYTYSGFNRKHDTVTIQTSDELYTQLPVGAYRLAAKLARGGALHVDMTLVGMYEASRGEVAVNELEGTCDGATHVLAAAQVGAFSLYAGGNTEVEATGASGGASYEVLNSDGVQAACTAASTADRSAPEGCGALLRLELSPLRAAPLVAAAAPPAPAAIVDVAAAAPPAPAAIVDVAPPADPEPADAAAPAPETAPTPPPPAPAPAVAPPRPPVRFADDDDHLRMHSTASYAAVDPTKIRHPLNPPGPLTTAPESRYRGLYAAGGVMFAAAVGGTIMGIVGAGRAAARPPDARLDPGQLRAFDERHRAAITLERSGLTLGLAGCVLGVVLFALGGRNQARLERWSRVRVAPMLARTTGGIDLTLRF